MKLYTITMKLPHASVAQKLFVTKSSMEKSYLSSFILFSESAPPLYESSSHEQRRICVRRRGDIAQKVCNELGGVVFFSVEVWVGRAAGGGSGQLIVHYFVHGDILWHGGHAPNHLECKTEAYFVGPRQLRQQAVVITFTMAQPTALRIEGDAGHHHHVDSFVPGE